MTPYNSRWRQDMRELLAEWQKILRLQDWNIELVFAPEWYEDGNAAQVHAFADHKSARIILSNEGNHTADCIGPWDPETFLVHELLHLPLDFLKKYNITEDKSDHDMLEAHIELTAQALVALRRSRDRQTEPA